MKLTKSEKKKIKNALVAAAVEGNVQAAKLLLGLAAGDSDEDPLYKMTDEELLREKEKLLNELKGGLK